MEDNLDIRYREALDFLFSQLPMFSRIGAAAYKPGLDTSIALDNYFGNPHKKFKSIHVGGTNGKGSTSHFLASILQSQGYKVGLYTSPHLTDFRERIRINGEKIPKEDVLDFVRRWQNCNYAGHPSFFELTMMMAFDYFARNEVDYAVIEVGMGGRLDSTNIITPIGCIITNISPDHMQFLGDTLEKIASEKAGIIKPGVPVVIGHAEGGVKEVFASKAAEVGAPITFAEDSPMVDSVRFLPEGALEIQTSDIGKFISPLGGEYQVENINTVLHAVDMLRNAGPVISNEALKRGLENVVTNTGLMGRWMITSKTPLTICDTGHNPAGMTCTMRQLRRVYKARRAESGNDINIRLVIGFVSDKDVDHISHLLPADAHYYVTNASVPRAMPAKQLYEKLTNLGLNCTLIESGVKDAYAAAVNGSAPDDIIYVGGSTFIVADYLT